MLNRLRSAARRSSWRCRIAPTSAFRNGSGDRERAADRRRRARGAHDRGELRFQGFDLAASSTEANSSARLATMAEMVCASSGVSRPAPTSSSRSA